MWKNTADPDRPQMPIRRMRLACWVTKVSDGHAGYKVLIVSHGNHGCTKAPQCYIIRTLSLLFIKRRSLRLFKFFKYNYNNRELNYFFYRSLSIPVSHIIPLVSVTNSGKEINLEISPLCIF